MELFSDAEEKGTAMTEKKTGAEFLKEYLANEEKYLPMVQYWKQQTKENPAPKGDLGWNAGAINGNRPYYYVCWATEGITTLSIYMTTKGMENATDEEVDRLMQENGIYRRKVQAEHKAQIDRFPSGENEFFLITQTVGVEDETYITSDCAYIFPFEALYEFNKLSFRERKKTSSGTCQK